MAQLQKIFQETLEKTALKHLKLEASYYPYAGIKSTVRRNNGTLRVRVSDALADAPPEVLRSLAAILIGKITGTPAKPHQARVFRSYVNSPQTQKKALRLAEKRTRKPLHAPQGQVRDLEKSFARVNAKYFHPPLEMPTLRWAPKGGRTRLGTYQRETDTITINPALDSKKVPEFVLDYILYHELLHKAIPIRYTKTGRRVVHGPEFKKREREFREFRKAREFLKGLKLKRAC